MLTEFSLEVVGKQEGSMSAKAVIRMPGEGKEVTLAGKPMAFLVTGRTRSILVCSN